MRAAHPSFGLGLFGLGCLRLGLLGLRGFLGLRLLLLGGLALNLRLRGVRGVEERASLALLVALDEVDRRLDARLRDLVVRSGRLQRLERLERLVAVSGLRGAARGAELRGEREVALLVRGGERVVRLRGLVELAEALEALRLSDRRDVGESVGGLAFELAVDVERALVAARVEIALREAQAEDSAGLRRAELRDGVLEFVGRVRRGDDLRSGGALVGDVLPDAVVSGDYDAGCEEPGKRRLEFLDELFEFFVHLLLPFSS